MPNSTTRIAYSDTDSQNREKPALKRQKICPDDDTRFIDEDVIMEDSTSMTKKTPYNPDKNAHLKGRRRFIADLSDIQEACAGGHVVSGLVLKKIRPGDDEGSVEVLIAKSSSEHVLSANLLISDTSEYPASHSLFGYSPDGDIPSKLQRIVEELAEEPPRTLGRTVQELFASVAKVVKAGTSRTVIVIDDSDSDVSGGGGSEDYDAFEDYDDIGVAPVEHDSIMAKLQENFVDIVATEYRPGFIRLGGNDFVVSVSLPVITLAESIPPRALMAWDRRLLASSQHLTLLITGFHGLYPVLESDASYSSAAQRLGVGLTFKVGLSKNYKPGNEHVQEVVRKHGLIIQDAEDELRIQAEIAAQKAKMYDWDAENEEDEQIQPDVVVEEEPEVDDSGKFDRFSLSSSLESLMDQSFLKIVKLRRKFALGWAGAEFLDAEVEKSQCKEEDVFAAKKKLLQTADRDEREIARTTSLPHDPLMGLGPDEPFNLPLTAFCYLVRRLSLCTRYCIVCHNKLHFDYEALKPYVCDSKLCAYQYYSLNRGPSLEYEIIHNPLTVDLLVSLAYVSAADGAMEQPLPVGMGLRVPMPSTFAAANPTSQSSFPGIPAPAVVQETPKVLEPGLDGLCDFDDLTLPQMRGCIAKLINSLPSIEDMKKHLERKVKAGKSKPKLKDIDSDILPAAWSILRWCVASCTAHIEAIDSGEELIKNLDPNWRQFRMTVGAPDAEAKFKGAVKIAMEEDSNARQYPVIYAFHGSPLKNWHSIIRHGLWYKTVANGRAYGDGVYLAKDATTSMGSYAAAARSSWQKSVSGPTNCIALAEVVNQTSRFVSSNPHYVVKDTHWIMCRYLLVKGAVDSSEVVNTTEPKGKVKKNTAVPFVKLDPKHKAAVNGKLVEIPDPSFKVENLLAARQADFVHEEPDEEDMAIFQRDQANTKRSASSQPNLHDHDLDDEDDYLIVPSSSSAPSAPKPKGPVVRPKDDWKHNAQYVTTTLENLMVPPLQSSPSASMAIQRELKSMVKEQDNTPSLRDLGWYMPPDLIGDNLYQWIVEMHSFDPALPIAKDLKAKKINSIIFEIRFPPEFPNSPPFFRIITPRFLPFIQGGGGHVTGGGSICMDLLTSDGWLPSYSISAVLMQIRLAISNLEPRPARLASDWNRPYGVQESLAGYKRAAATHNWTLPLGLDRLVR